MKLFKHVLTICLVSVSTLTFAESDRLQFSEAFNAHFDFARSIHGWDFLALEQQGLAVQEIDTNNEVFYRVNFEKPNFDAYGNAYSGTLRYYKQFSNEVSGNVHRMEFDEFQINDIKVSGSKMTIDRNIKRGVVRASDWCSKDCGMTVGSSLPLVFEFKDGQIASFEGNFRKEIKFGLDGVKTAYITGKATMRIDDKSVDFEVTEPMQMTGACRWMTKGLTTMFDEQGKSLGTIDLSSDACTGAYRLATATGDWLAVDRQHSLWQ